MIHDTTRKAAEPDQAEASEPVSARVLRQVLRTPSFREILHLHLNELGRGDGRSLVRALLREDPEVWLGVASTTPRLIDTVTESLVELGRELAAMPPALVDAYLQEVIRDIDRETLRELSVVWAPILAQALPGVLNTTFDALAGAAAAVGALEPAARESALVRLMQGVRTERAAAAINGLAAVVIRTGREHPTLFEDPPGPDWAALVRSIDHGKLREAVIVASGFIRRSVQPLVAQWLTDPVASANLMLALPALVNDGVRLLSFAVDRMDLPDELLASAVFNVVRELDLAALSALVSGAAHIINVLHRGSATLGLDEPAFKAVFVELVDGLLESVDQQGVADAVVALGEDGDVMARVLARRLSTDPALLSRALDTTVRLLNVALATGREVLTEIDQLPGATLEEVGSRLDDVDPRGLGEVLNLLLRGVIRGERLLGRQGWLEEVLAAVDWEEAGELLWRLATPVARSYAAAGWRQYRERPEDLGRWINGQLVRFNRYVAANPERVSAFVPRALSAVDTRELTRAMGAAWRLLGGAVYATAQARPLLQSLLSPPWRRRSPEAEVAP